MSQAPDSAHADTFERHRGRLLGLAYRMLGSRADAEDMVQEAYLRWDGAAQSEIRTPEAWLVTTVTRLCIDRLRQLRTERETYVGTWLPEPLVAEAEPAADAAAELASDLSVAFLALLERLAPEERAAFLLHDVFDTDYRDVAKALGKSEVACRQIVSRARSRVRSGRPRMRVSHAAQQRLLETFVQAMQARDRDALLALFAEEAAWTSDGGGKTKAALKVVRGRDRVVRFVLGISRYFTDAEFAFVVVNDEPGVIVRKAGRPYVIWSIQSDGERILDFYSILNPDKLRRVPEAATLH